VTRPQGLALQNPFTVRKALLTQARPKDAELLRPVVKVKVKVMAVQFQLRGQWGVLSKNKVSGAVQESPAPAALRGPMAAVAGTLCRWLYHSGTQAVPP
jgi:hypothetical protein